MPSETFRAALSGVAPEPSTAQVQEIIGACINEFSISDDLTIAFRRAINGGMGGANGGNFVFNNHYQQMKETFPENREDVGKPYSASVLALWRSLGPKERTGDTPGRQITKTEHIDAFYHAARATYQALLQQVERSAPIGVGEGNALASVAADTLLHGVGVAKGTGGGRAAPKTRKTRSDKGKKRGAKK